MWSSLPLRLRSSRWPSGTFRGQSAWKEPLEAIVLDVVQKRLKALLAGEAEALLRQLIDDENLANADDPRREISTVRARLSDIDRKLRDLAVEKRALEQRLSELEAFPYQTIDVEAILLHGKEALRSFLRLMGVLDPGKNARSSSRAS